ncbi:uncharacterized protein LOC110711778 isoform X1 [Chenopodium quinoa]|uniref:uncharacterized protein LOC110711778 isoform X1 n=1 Tax=Chenopodium quinoa TaxID=63459 RepID=UPI000B78204B|nr:uncharacterized protein LOC110711778 isoform X1 [Chenopodium quinoa]XP_021745889.1 uncharacterized protein LOC110711778 isoform X1 [Chenopodium quinoa]
MTPPTMPHQLPEDEDDFVNLLFSCPFIVEETSQQTSGHNYNSAEISLHSAVITELPATALTPYVLDCEVTWPVSVPESTEPCVLEVAISVQYDYISPEANLFSEPTEKATASTSLQELSSKEAHACSTDNNTSATKDMDDLAESPILTQLEDSDTYSTDMSMTSDSYDSYTEEIKNEPNQKLLDDIRKINNKLNNIVLEVDSVSSSAFGAMNKTIVRCSYNPIAFSNDITKQFASTIPVCPFLFFLKMSDEIVIIFILLLTRLWPYLYIVQPGAISIEFLVPSDYPNSPPQILDKQPAGYSKEVKEMLKEAKYRFYSFAEGLKKLKELAGAWDHCAWSTFYDFAHKQAEQGLTIKEQISTLATKEHFTIV